MKKMIVAAVLLACASAAMATTAYFKYERAQGMYKICYYSAMGQIVAITIRSVQICPLTIEI